MKEEEVEYSLTQTLIELKKLGKRLQKRGEKGGRGFKKSWKYRRLIEDSQRRQEEGKELENWNKNY